MTQIRKNNILIQVHNIFFKKYKLSNKIENLFIY